MNYLAHAYLSFDEPEILIGNMISDFVKGKKKFEFPVNVQHGIMLHRSIDDFTDTHRETIKAKQFFRPAYRLYSGAFVDVIFDYFLARDKNEFPSDDRLEQFCIKVYETLEKHFTILPKRFQHMLPYMKTQNWLYNYQFNEGLEKGLGGLVYRALYIHESATALSLFHQHYNVLENCYKNFFPEVKKFAANQLSNLLDS